MRYSAKELISVGVFTAVYIVIYLIFNMVGAISPVFQLVGGLVGTVLNGITFMLLLTRIEHRGLITLMALILGTLVTVGGHHPISILTALVAGVCADLLAAKRNFREQRTTIASYAVFCLWVVGAYLPLLFLRADVIAEYRDQMGDEWADAFNSLFSPGMVIALIVLTFVAGLLGGIVGRRALLRHFERAGLA